ncbi:hypothetical protein BVER_00370 [Candidatus Burkholderia verschuerenii]|uniref:Uncharacterized protein n=1 Tax=Candidatus Burkholderia verschuerenii TaxID=242163 RepID=A0A0L0M743_9BURK|nr:hypothetical protein [Candidatus Burkholderia verschuerenii]KND58110.1 hypothetical protein BVER_00370 [Candidatus Burkholderia verschuerenii]
MNDAYLDVRCAYVIAKLNLRVSEQFGALFPNANASIDLESREFDEIDLELIMDDQISEAERLGWCDAQADGDDQVPLLFADEPALSSAWKRGVRQHDLTVELENCSSCRAAGFDPCPFHG